MYNGGKASSRKHLHEIAERVEHPGFQMALRCG